MENIANSESNNIAVKSSKKISSLFKTIAYDDFKCIKFDEYYSFNNEIKRYSCKICSENKYFKEKCNIERHLKEQHFYAKEICKDCGKSILRMKAHICTVKLKNNDNNVSINKKLCENMLYSDINDYINPTKPETIYDEKNNSIFKITLLKELDKVYSGNIFFYKNRLINEGHFGKVFLGGCKNSKDVLAIKVIKADNIDKYNRLLEEKTFLVSLRNKKNSAILYDWKWGSNFIMFAE